MEENEEEAAGADDMAGAWCLLSQWKEMLNFKCSFVKVKDVVFSPKFRPWIRTSVISPTALSDKPSHRVASRTL